MSTVDVSIIIVHTFEKNLVRQTLRSIGRAAPAISYEIIIVDNNPSFGMKKILDRQFPSVRYLTLEKNVGFGAAMNVGIGAAKGKYILIFNPDIIVGAGSLEALCVFMDTHPSVGIVGPKLLNPDGTLQYSCYRIPTIFTPAYRRTFLQNFSFGKREIESYLMINDSHNETMDVDSLIGAALFSRRQTLERIGFFDERFFMYYEDNDLCRRVWEAGESVVYLPEAKMVHFHRRASADGTFFQQILSRFTWIQIASALKYFWKYRGKSSPRLTSNSQQIY